MNFNWQKFAKINIFDKKKTLSIIKWIWIIVIIFISFFYFYSRRESAIFWLRKIPVYRILISSILLFIGKLLIAKVIHYTVKSENWHPTYIELLEIISITEPGKYIPGGIWHFLGRYGIYKLRSMSVNEIAKVIFFENFWLISSSITLGGTLIYIYKFESISNLISLPDIPYLAHISSLIWILLWFLIIYIINNFGYFKNYQGKIKLFVLIVSNIFIWIIIGTSFYVLFENIRFEQSVFFIGGYALSWVTGYLSIFAPGGIGIREGMLTLLLSNKVEKESVVMIASVHRMIWILIDVIFGLFFSLRKKVIKKDFIDNNKTTVNNLD